MPQLTISAQDAIDEYVRSERMSVPQAIVKINEDRLKRDVDPVEKSTVYRYVNGVGAPPPPPPPTHMHMHIAHMHIAHMHMHMHMHRGAHPHVLGLAHTGVARVRGGHQADHRGPPGARTHICISPLVSPLYPPLYPPLYHRLYTQSRRGG